MFFLLVTQTITNLILQVFHCIFAWFSLVVFMAFSRFHDFRESGRHAIDFSRISLGWDLAGPILSNSHRLATSNKNGIEKPSVLRARFKMV